MPEPEKLTPSQLLADLTNHVGYRLLMDDVFGKIIAEAEGRIWDSHSPEERAARVEMVADWKALMTTVNAKIQNALNEAQQQKKGQSDVQKTQRPGRR